MATMDTDPRPLLMFLLQDILSFPQKRQLGLQDIRPRERRYIAGEETRVSRVTRVTRPRLDMVYLFNMVVV